MRRPTEWLKWSGIAAFVLWFFFVVGSYLVVYKPFSPELISLLSQTTWLPLGDGAAVGAVLLDLLVGGWITAVWLGVGAWVWRAIDQWPGLPDASAAERLLFSAGLGGLLIGLLVLAIGLVGGLQTTVLFTLMGVGTAVGLPGLWSLRQGVTEKSFRFGRPALLYIILAVGMMLTLALLPPTNWDGLFYHLKGPKLYLAAGRIYPGVDIPHFNFPSLFQMHFLLGMGLRGDVTAQLLHTAFVPLLGGMVATIARQMFKLEGGETAVLFLLATPMTLTLAAWSYNDLVLAFYSVGGLLAFWRWREQSATGWLLLCALFAGGAMSLKYTSLVTPLFLGLAVCWVALPRRDIRSVLIYGLLAVAVASPWYLKNWAFTGNPVYPFLFDGLYWDAFRSDAYGQPGTGIGWDWLAILRLPYEMTLALSDASQDGLAGPIYAGFLPLLLVVLGLRWRGKRPFAPLNFLLLYVLANYLFWIVGVVNSEGLWQVRLFYPGLVALCPVLAWLFDEIRAWDHPQFSLRNLMNLALGFVLGMLLLNQFWGWLGAQPWAYLSGAESREAYLTRRLGEHYVTMQALNEQLPPDAVVTFLWEPRSYYCDLDCRPDSILDKYGHLVYLHDDAAGIAEAWRTEGVTHLLIWQTGLDFLRQTPTGELEPMPPELVALQERYLRPLPLPDEVGYSLWELER